MVQSRSYSGLLNRLLQIIVLGYQALAVAVLIATLSLASNWLRQPFLGAFVEHTLVFNGVGPKEKPGWELLNRGYTFGNQLVAVNGQNVSNAADIHTALESATVGETIPVTIRTPQGEVKTEDVTLTAFPDRWTYLYLPSLLSLGYLVISLWIFGLRRSESAGRAFALLVSSMAIVSGALFDLYTTHYLTHIWTLAMGIAGGAMIDLGLAFPQEARFSVGRPYLRWFGYVIGLVLVGYAYTTLFDFSHPAAYLRAWQALYAFNAISFLFFLVLVIWRILTARSPIVRNQAQTILWGGIVGFGPLVVWLILAAVFGSVNFSPYILILTIIFPFFTGYTILRYRIFSTDYFLRRGLLYALLSVITVGGYALLVSGVSLIFGQRLQSAHPLVIGLTIFLLALLFNPLRDRLQQSLDMIFLRGQRAYQERLKQFAHELTNALDLPTIQQNLRETIQSTLMPSLLHIYTYDLLMDQFVAAPDETGQPTSDIRFAANSPLVQYMYRGRQPLYSESSTLPEAVQSERARLALLGAELYIPMSGKERLNGWLALGPLLSGRPYTDQQLQFLENLADQASLAIERAQIVFNMHRSVQEMSVINRISQGINITLSFDDILELINAQTFQVIPATDFHITLYNRTGGYFYYAFSLENNDRLVQQENIPLPPSQGLAPQIIQQGRPILTQDYMGECQMRNVRPALQGVHAWMGVPLNSGAETIGALSVGSRDPTVTYTRGQLDLLQAIANQTAGAIVKARLFKETEERARQLSTLNEITKRLTSTLETDPLLQTVLENAVSILNCEAGSLFLVDENTDDLIFRVTVGPVGSNLLGQRLPAGSGIVGRAVQTRNAVLENDVQRSVDWFPNTDQQTGFVSRSILAVPMQVKDRVVGVIEVINRKDGLPFVQEDAALLMAFAGQAAIALENARLYTLTDQELAARVEELSVMQRIDRELNASLEIDRAMRITLDWAMRQSSATAGLIGVVTSDGLRLMAHQGYGSDLDVYANSPMPLNQSAMESVIETGQAQRILLDPEEGGGILPGARSQIIIPIRRETTVIGLMLLESVEEFGEDISFLIRLSDHAAIAISNAQLYAEVQAANLAKSDFVSFVAHELKNPMTSIKGYTELLAAGAVGAINENQANFLQTIRSNVERMSTLVSDLNDNSKIEAGRLRLEFKAVDVPEVIDEVIRSTHRQIEEKKQSVEVRLSHKLPPVWADRTRLGQVLTNLLSNAHKYTPEEGHIVIGAEESDNQWDPQGAARVIHIWVQDNGIGISLEDQRKIFNKFFRSEDQKAREAPGTGLGLNITKSLVEMQGGRIWFESVFREGTTFHFTIPVAEGY
jgi:signal transduction histidine kinase